MRPLLFATAILLLSCSSDDPAPGQTCKPTPSATATCYDSKNLLFCEKQSDGEYRWSEFLECDISIFSSERNITLASCGCSRPVGATAGYPNLDGSCNCWGSR